MKGDFVALEAEPLEEAGVRGGAWDDGGDEFPALLVVVDIGHGNAVLFAVFAYEPEEYFQITYAPVPLELARLGHPSSRDTYFSMRFSVSWMTV